ncbi:MAG: hypothetical protein ACYTGH_22270, partial [Planctomycetota bacterium]
GFNNLFGDGHVSFMTPDAIMQGSSGITSSHYRTRAERWLGHSSVPAEIPNAMEDGLYPGGDSGYNVFAPRSQYGVWMYWNCVKKAAER